METNQQNNNIESNPNVDVNPTAEEKQGVQKQEEKRLFSQDEVDAIVNKRLAKERKRNEEANKLAQMSAEERASYQYESKLTELSEKEKELEKRELEFNKKAMLNQTQQELLTRNLPVDFAQLLVTDNAESTKANIDAFNKSWNEALSKAVDARIKTAAKEPRANRNNDNSMARKEAKKMSLEDRAKLKATDPERFNQLFGRK